MPDQQQQINYGAAPNDGQGDPLRDAFIKTDDNFDAIWNAGPVGSNITVLNNTVAVANTNGNLILRPNGVGVIQANASIVPDSANIRDLGAANRRWRRVYLQTLNTVDYEVEGNLTVSGNLTIQGDTIQIGNLVTDAKTLQLSNTAANAAQAAGSGITVGANDDIATLLYDSGNNVWDTNIGLSVSGAITGVSVAVSDAVVYGNVTAVVGDFTGNVTANYFIGDGSQLTGLPEQYGNANVATFLADFGSNNIETTGNIDAGRLDIQNGIGNAWVIYGERILAPSGGEWRSENDSGDDFITSANDGYINLQSLYADGNIASELKLEHGIARLVVADAPFVEWTFNTSGQLDVPGNIVPDANGVYSLGSESLQWANLWVANNTIYLGGVAIGVTGNVLTVAGEPVLSNDSASSITTTGNLTADNITASGNVVTANIYSSGNVGIYADNIELTSYYGPCNFSTTYTIDSQGWFNLPGNIFSVRYANGGQVDLGGDTGFFTFDETTMSVPNDSSMTLQVRDDEQAVRSSLLLDSNDGLTRLSSLSSERDTSYNTGNWSTATWTSNNLQFIDAPDIVAFVDTGDYNNSVNRTFSINGGPRLPYDGASWGGNNITFYTSVAADPDPTTVTTIEFFYQYQSRIQMDYDDEEIVIQAQDMDIIIVGDDDIYIEASDDIDIEAGGSIDIDSQQQIDIRSYSTTDSVRIITDADNVTRTWDFGVDGTLTVPGDITVVGDVTGTSGASTLVLRAQPESNTSIQLNNIVDSTISIAANLDIVTDSSNTAQTWQFDTTGNLNLPQGGVILEGNIDGMTTMEFVPGDPQVASQRLVLKTGFGEEYHLHLTTGDPAQTAIFLGTDDQHVKINALNGDVDVLTKADSTFNITVPVTEAANAAWTFDAARVLTVPGNINFGGDSSAAPSLNDFFSITSAGDFDIVTGTASTAQTFEFDAGGNLTVPGNVSAARLQNDANLVIRSNAAGTAKNWTFDTLGDLSLPAGGNISGSGLITADRINVTGNVDAGNVIAGYVYGDSLEGNVLTAGTANVAGNINTTTGVYANVSIVVGDVANAAATKTRFVTEPGFSYIQTGNGTAGSTGNIVFSPYSDPTQRVAIDTSSGNVTAGNITLTGTVVSGSAANITFEAGAYTMTFDTTGNLTTSGANGNITGAYVVSAAVVRTVPTTVSLLPAANVVGAGSRAFVTDANTATFGTTITGGAANVVPVYSDGTAWRVG